VNVKVHPRLCFERNFVGKSDLWQPCAKAQYSSQGAQLFYWI